MSWVLINIVLQLLMIEFNSTTNIPNDSLQDIKKIQKIQKNAPLVAVLQLT